MKHTPAFILRSVLIDGSVVGLPADLVTWPAYVGSLPNTTSDPDEAVGFYDTAPFIDGRSIRTGEVIKHPGVAIVTRSLLYDKGYSKADDILRYLTETVKRSETVLLLDGFEEFTYRIESVTLSSGIIALGEGEVRARQSFSMNLLCTITQL